MREWQLKAGDPLALTLACDIRLNPSDYCDDQIWELTLGGGDPPALALHTTYGLRARLMRLFPRFIQGEVALTDPAEFAGPPIIRHITPNYLLLTCSPFPGIDVTFEYWVPQSQAIAGRINVANNGAADSRLILEWVALLNPEAGQRMAAVEMQAVTVLAGHSGKLAPVIFMTGGPKLGSGVYPSLAQRMELAPGANRQITWVHAALGSSEASFSLARSIAAQKWEAEVSRLEMVNSRQVELFTGDPDWDAALMLAQKSALGLMIGPTANLPHPSAALTRQPDTGYSTRGDGSDYGYAWNGQSPLEMYFLVSQLVYSAPELASGLVRNFLSVQLENGFIDWRPGLGGQRSKIMAAPLLASLVWQVYEVTEDLSLLNEAFEPLLRFIQAWFGPEHDRDGDGIPEWDHPMQAGDEDHPLYSRWHTWAQGVEITSTESVGLCAFLHRECLTLVRIARVIGQEAAIPGLETTAEHLRLAVEAAWNESEASYFDWDRDTHQTTHGETLLETHGAGMLMLRRSFERPVRLRITIRTEETARRRPIIFVHGKGASGKPRIERITDEGFRWTPGLGRLTGRHVYSAIERVEIIDLEPDDEISLASVGYDSQDHSTLAPLWAKLPSPARAAEWLENTITNPERFWHAWGIPACTHPPQSEEAAVCASTNLLWNLLVGEGLLQYGFRQEAAELVTRLLRVTVMALKHERAFRRYYQADSGAGLGERHALSGLAPLSLFLETLGVRLISSRRVGLNGFNPFPRPVTVKYRGLTLLCQKDKTTVIFPDGQTVVVDDPSPRIISLE